MKLLKSLLYCGQDKAFFKENKEAIDDNNVKIMRGVNIGMALVSLVYTIFNFNDSGETKSRLIYLSFAIFYTILFILYLLIVKKKNKFKLTYIYIIYEITFAFLVLVEPVFDKSSQSIFLPVFFTLSYMLIIEPFIYSGHVILTNFTITIILEFVFKNKDLAIYDTINIVTCTLIGIFVGYFVLTNRVDAINAYNKLKTNSESELAKALEAANTDSLTGVKSRSAYERDEANINVLIKEKKINQFGIVLADINWLKECNDSKGHDSGDKLIIEVANTLKRIFVTDKLYRIGGDEFVIILDSNECNKSNNLMNEVKNDLKNRTDGVSYSCGLSLYNKEKDKSLNDVFIRADIAMYDRKKIMKRQSDKIK